MPALDLNDLAVFVRVVDRGGFGSAAREIGVPTSTVSRTVARLESLVGARLLHRTTRNVQPTSDGRELYERVAGAVATLQQAARALEPTAAIPRGRLRITAPADIGSGFVAEVLVEFVERYPGVEVDLLATNRVVNLVEEGLDVALRMGRLSESSLVARKVGELEACFYAAPGYLVGHGEPASLEDLAKHRLAVFRAKDGEADLPLKTKAGVASLRVHGQFCSDDFSFLRAVVLASGGIGLLPRIVCALDEAEGRLVRVLRDIEMPGSPLYVVYPTSQHVPARVTAFRDFFVEAFAAHVARSREPPASDPPAPNRGRKPRVRNKKPRKGDETN